MSEQCPYSDRNQCSRSVVKRRRRRLAQMMDASGLKFGNLTSQHNQNFAGNFAGQNSGQGRKGGLANAAEPANADENDENNAEISVEKSENLINMQA